MGVLTDFFVASPAQLVAAFPGWRAVQEEPVLREYVNPFNGHKQMIRTWEPLPGPAPPATLSSQSPDFSTLPNIQLKNVELLMLCSLKWVLSGVKEAETFSDAIGRPALIQPSNEDCGLHQLPELLVTDLAGILPGDIPNLGKRWWTEEEIARQFSIEECSEVLEKLSRLAIIATSSQAGMFLFWSL